MPRGPCGVPSDRALLDAHVTSSATMRPPLRDATTARSDGVRRVGRAAMLAAIFAACSAVEDDSLADATADVPVDRVDAREAGTPDAGRPDAGARDAGPSDIPSPDISRPDVPSADVRTADVPTADVPAPDAGPPPEPGFSAIPWSEPGYGVAYRDSANPSGQDVFIGYAGYGVQAAPARQWVTQLFRDALHDRGVRHVYAVQGPREPGYNSQEIGNSRLIAHLLPRLAPGARVLVAAHSSGAFVAHELLGQLYQRGLDPSRLTAGRLSYWNLDGGSYGLNASIVGQLHHAWFVWSDDAPVATRSPNAGVMLSAGATYASAGGALALDARASGCNRGATWCVHMHLITTRPHDPAAASAALDYGSFDATHRVQTDWLTRTGFGAP